MFSNRKLLSVFAGSAALAAASLILDRSASADLSQCSARPGTLRFFDFETGRCGYIFDDNNLPNWGVFGLTKQADQIGNDGFSNICLYDGIGCRGAHVLLPVGSTVDWRNSVSSSVWVTGNSCPTSC